MKEWLFRVSAWMSQTVNLWLLGGHHNMTVSARCYINRKKKYWRVAYKLINLIFFWQEDHCRESLEVDIEYADMIMDYK